MVRPSVIALFGTFLAAMALAAPPTGGAPQSVFDDAIRKGREAVAAGKADEGATIFRQVCPAEKIESFTHSMKGSCYLHLGLAAMRGSQPETAPEIFRKASAAWIAAGPGYIDTWGYTQLILTDLYRQQRQLVNAEEAIIGYVEKARQAARTSEVYPQALSRLALTYAETGRPELAHTTILEAVGMFGKLATPMPLEMAFAQNNLGLIGLSMGLQADAENALRAAVQTALKELGEMNVDTAGYQTNLALALLAKGDLDGAETLLKRARYVVERLPGASGNQLGMIAAELSSVFVMRDKLGLAGEEARRALDILSHQRFPDKKAVSLAQVNLADVHLRANRLPEADQLLSEAIAAERVAAPGSRLLADGLRRVGQLRSQQHRWKDASEAYREAIELYELRVGANNPAIAPLLREYANTLRRNGGSKDEIRGMEARAKSIGSVRVSGFAPMQ